MVKSDWLKAAAIFLLLFLILSFKRPDALTNPQFFAEDGQVFFHDQVLFGSPEALTIPHAGYLHTIPRLAALAASWFPIREAPLIYNIMALLITAFACGLFALPAFRFIVRSDGLRLAACCVMAAGLEAGELIGSITQVQWYLEPAAVLLLLYSGRRTAASLRTTILLALTMLLLALTVPMLIVAVPIALWFLYRAPAHGKWVSAAMLAGVGIQTLIYLNVGSARGHSALFQSGGLVEATAAYLVFRALISILLGRPEGMVLSSNQQTVLEATAIGTACALILLAWLWTRLDTRARIMMLTALYLSVVSAAISIGARDLPRVAQGITFGGERYFYMSACCTLLLAVLAVEAIGWSARWNKFAPLVLLVLFSMGLKANYRTPPFTPLDWQASSVKVAAWLKAMRAGVPLKPMVVDINPSGWFFLLDGSVLTNGGFEQMLPWMTVGSVSRMLDSAQHWQGQFSMAMWGQEGDMTQLVRGIRPGSRMQAAAMVYLSCAAGITGSLILEDGRGRRLASAPADPSACGHWQKLTAMLRVTGTGRVFVRLHDPGGAQRIYWDDVQLQPVADHLWASWGGPGIAANPTPVPRYSPGAIQWGVPLPTLQPPTLQLGVFRPGSSGGVTLEHQSSDALVDVLGSFGLPGDQAFMGDWTGNGTPRIGVFRQGTWYLDLNGNRRWDGEKGGDGVYQFGLPGDIAVAGDWTGTGVTRFGVFRCPSKGVCAWVLDKTGARAFDKSAVMAFYGLQGDLPVVARWKPGDRADHIGVFRHGTWIVDSNGDNAWEPEDASFAFGIPGDVPVVSRTLDKIGVFRHGFWILDTNGQRRWDISNAAITAPIPEGQPLIGEW